MIRPSIFHAVLLATAACGLASTAHAADPAPPPQTQATPTGPADNTAANPSAGGTAAHAAQPAPTAAAAGPAYNFAPLPPVKDDGTITAPSFELPFSSYASPEARAMFIARLRAPDMPMGGIAQMRKMVEDTINTPQLAISSKLYPYHSVKAVIGGVPVETFTPDAGVAPRNKNRILISLHGGGMITGGGGPGGALEAVPIMGVGRIKVIAVDYRLAPEHHFPAASEDVATVYRELLKTYRPENIGIYGCSAGGSLTGQSVAWFIGHGLPVPGAIAIMCASLDGSGGGDSAQIAPRMGSLIRMVPTPRGDTFGPGSPYLSGESTTNPLIIPSASKEMLAKYPPTLFLTGTRAPEASAAAHSHLVLRELGVPSDLLLFDGLDHGFYTVVTLPESQRAYRLITNFFAENLGKRRKP